MEINFRDVKDYKIIVLKGEMNYFNCVKLRDVLYKLIQNDTASIMLDLKDVTFIDSAGMGLLINTNKKINMYNGKMGLLNPTEEILNLLKLATLDRIIPIYHSEDDIK